jgi:hypothetical protein
LEFQESTTSLLKKRLQKSVAAELQNVGGGARGDAVGPLRGGGRVDCMRNMFILNEIWAQGKIYILLRSSLG